jgi:hypothetical protein
MVLPRHATLALLLSTAGLPAQRTKPTPVRIVGEVEARVERVRERPDGTTVLTLLVGPHQPAVDPGDELRLYGDDGETTVATASVVGSTRPQPGSARMHVPVRIGEADAPARLTARAAERLVDYPRDAGATRDAFVRTRAPRAVIRCAFDPTRGDDPAAFVVVGATGSSEPTGEAAKAQPRSSFTLRFDAPIDAATLNRVRILTGDRRVDVPCRVFDVDGDGTRFRFDPPLGLAFFDSMRNAAQPHYVLDVPGGEGGLCAKDGAALFAPLALPITIDPDAISNLVTWR